MVEEDIARHGMTEKTQFLGFMFPQVVQRQERWDIKLPFGSTLSATPAKKLPKSVDVC